jgi:L,D-peptidoglycan transpeptidase YkuD (ErfK/YbiS/YcfS/YnhG family)
MENKRKARVILVVICGVLMSVACGLWGMQKKAEAQVADQEAKRLQQEASLPTVDWVTNLNVANQTNQLIIVAASGTSATVSMHTKGADGVWVQNLTTNGYVGAGGVGQASEYATCSPRGVWGFTCAFGNQPNPGTALGYTQVDDTYYWVDDVNSAYYNRFVTTREVAADWSSAEHISGCGSVYNYVLALNYNADCIPGNGSAFFLHCSSGKPTAGCVSVPESVMIQILQNIQPGCLIVIDTESGVYGY